MKGTCGGGGWGTGGGGGSGKASCDVSNAELSICDSLENNNLDNQRRKPCSHEVTVRSSLGNSRNQ